MKIVKVFNLLFIIALYILGTLEAFTGSTILAKIEGAIMFVSSYAILYLSAKHNLLPHCVVWFINWISDTTDND